MSIGQGRVRVEAAPARDLEAGVPRAAPAPLRLSETPPRWVRPSVPLGYNEPVRPARAT
jgi:hypothetical protein